MVAHIAQLRDRHSQVRQVHHQGPRPLSTVFPENSRYQSTLRYFEYALHPKGLKGGGSRDDRDAVRSKWQSGPFGPLKFRLARSKKLLGGKGIATRSKDATNGAPGLTRNKKLLETRSPYKRCASSSMSVACRGVAARAQTFGPHRSLRRSDHSRRPCHEWNHGTWELTGGLDHFLYNPVVLGFHVTLCRGVKQIDPWNIQKPSETTSM